MNNWRGKSVDYLNVSDRVLSRLHENGINTLITLVKKSKTDLMKMKWFGRKSLTDVVCALDEIGLHLSASRCFQCGQVTKEPYMTEVNGRKI